jgi:hypothetical protein
MAVIPVRGVLLARSVEIETCCGAVDDGRAVESDPVPSEPYELDPQHQTVEFASALMAHLKLPLYEMAFALNRVPSVLVVGVPLMKTDPSFLRTA